VRRPESPKVKLHGRGAAECRPSARLFRVPAYVHKLAFLLFPLAALLLWAVRQRMEFARLCLYNPIRDCNRPCIQLDASHRWARNSSAAARRVRWAARYMTDRFPPDVLQAAHLMAES